MQSDEEAPLMAVLPLLHRLVFSDSAGKEKSGLTKSQALILMALAYRESLTMKEIAGYIASSSEQATRAVAPLVDAGYVERYTLPENRTHIHIRLTQKGADGIAFSRRQFGERIRSRLDASLSAEEIARLLQIMREAAGLLSKVR